MLRAMDVLLEARYNTGEREDGWSDWFEAHWAIPSWGKGWGTETVWEFRRAP